MLIDLLLETMICEKAKNVREILRNRRHPVAPTRVQKQLRDSRTPKSIILARIREKATGERSFKTKREGIVLKLEPIFPPIDEESDEHSEGKSFDAEDDLEYLDDQEEDWDTELE